MTALTDNYSNFIHSSTLRPDCLIIALSVPRFFMVRHDELCERIVSSKNDVAPFLTFEMKAGFLQGFHTVTP